MNNHDETVLIVDDEKAIRMLLKAGLAGNGHTCFEASNAAEALEVLRDHDVAVALLDVSMPGRSGIELLSAVKAGYPDTVVIMATASADTETAVRCLKEGAYDYFAKPFAIDEVGLSVGRALEKRRLERELRGYRQHLERKVEEQATRIRAGFVSAVTALALALEAKDPYTEGHSQRVADISAAIARAMGLSEVSIEKIRLAGLIHDIGKIGVKESVLNKPGALTEVEHRHVMLHCETGERILKPVVEDREILDIVRHHHERFDGAGYPDGLSARQIPRGATILAAADALDAMTSSRPYRNALPLEDTLSEIRRGAGTQFDPDVVDTLLRIKDSVIHCALTLRPAHGLVLAEPKVQR